MKKYRLIIIIAVPLILIPVSLYAFWMNKAKKGDKVQSIKQLAEPKVEKTDENNSQDNSIQPTELSKEMTPVNNNLATFTEVSLTAYLNKETMVGPNGSQAPTGAIMIYFYMPQGAYTVQKKTSEIWKDVVTNFEYPGHGGLWAFYMEESENLAEYRVLKLANGQPVAISKIFKVQRDDLASGMRTYN